MAIPEIIAQAKQIDVADYISRRTPIAKVAGHEWAGPCPKCQGTDRFHCTAEWWFCRQCHDERGDAIDFVRWLDSCTFQEATEKLTNQPWPERKIAAKQSRHASKCQPADWRSKTELIVQSAQERLGGSEGQKARDYLLGRGLQPDTWQLFGLGYRPDASLPGTEGKQKAPAIVIPWFAGGRLVAVRYRFLETHKYTDIEGNEREEKQTAQYESDFVGKVYGGQAIPSWVSVPLQDRYRSCERFCTLIVCEGEINAMSIWQIAHSSNVHVLSVGSESARLADSTATFAQRYGTVIVWMDKDEKAKGLMGRINGSYGFASPDGKDANDMLQAGTLGGQIVALRWQSARSDDERERVFWDLWDAANEGDGLDTSSAMAFKKLCEYRARDFDLVEVEAGKRVTLHKSVQRKAA